MTKRPLARDRSRDVGKRRFAKLTAEGSTMVTARVPNDLAKKVETLAAKELISMADFLRRALLREVKANKDPFR